MTVIIFLVIISFLTIIEGAMPFLLKKTIVFGVTIPEDHIADHVLANYKKTYSAIIFIAGLMGMIYFTTFGLTDYLEEETVVFRGLIILFLMITLSMVLYLFFHGKTTKRKRDNAWGANLKQVQVADLSRRSADEMLPSLFFVLPMIITFGLISYTASQYSLLPEEIPTHWGIDGTADAFTQKNPFSSIAILLILFIIQAMMFATNLFTKKSGMKLNAARRNSSRIQQLSFRKYTSWILFMTTLLMTILVGYFQLMTIHGQLGGPILMMALPIGFALVMLISTAIYAFKVGQGGARIQPPFEEDSAEGITTHDDDRFWKAGVFYVNRNDPSIFVEKRFGVGWTINFGNPVGYFILFLPIVIILGISLLL
ncbi:DUF1648 domain-containing protein [Sporosarcina sp. Sa2YVA2]|uniref:DUF1648 domain-containing protein n=1 Tax=Sporosarcina quadrami TaxID=2762234 RepID=A0ABR8U9N9_9BACL|nr:DUF5808 domain-containing protein [Sporosarcina quadrami]MBD7984239.1 DUF1648 domain-containing protein [Sporosarcina quadrami]